MALPSLKEQIIAELDKLTPNQQQQMLEIVKSFQSELPPGIPGEVLVARAKELNFAPEDLKEMAEAIEEGWGQIDWEGWD
jgi:hypothetical protein